jgi:signal transduction histidine kinase
MRSLRHLAWTRSIRLRLTALYAGVFLAAGAILLTMTYLLLAHSLPDVANSADHTAAPPKATAPAAGKGTQSPSLSPSPSPSPSPSLSPKTTSPSNANSTDKLVEYCKGENATTGHDLAQCLANANAGADVAAEDQRRRTLSDLLNYSLLGLGVTTVLSGVLGWVVAGRALRPVTAAIAKQRRFVADASHELRTPLTVMRTAIDVTLAKPTRAPEHLEAMAVEVREAVERAEDLVEALLTLARSENPTAAPEPVDLATAAEDALDAASAELRANGLRATSALEPAPCRGNAVLLERLVSNLVDNAVRHNKPGGELWIRTGASGHGRAFVEVENEGPVIPDDTVAGLFEPFRRLEERTGPGSGIGLSIVAAVASAHGGTVDAHARPGGGLRVRVEI